MWAGGLQLIHDTSLRVQHPDALDRQWQHDFLTASTACAHPRGGPDQANAHIGVFSTAKVAAELRSIVADDAVFAR